MSPAISSPTRSEREIRRLSTLHDVSVALSGTLHLASAIQEAVAVLERHHQAGTITVVLRDESTGRLMVSACTRPAERGRPAPHDEIVERVVESGRPVLLPRVEAAPRAGRPAARRAVAGHRSLICVPLVVDDVPVGAIRAELPFKGDRNYDRSLGFYRVVASMVGEALRLARLVEGERRRLTGGLPPAMGHGGAPAACRRLIGTSRAMQRVHALVRQVAHASATVLIRGESGTGKELIAQAIHEASPRARKPFVKVSCAALPEALLESELFGHEKGAFTGAHSLKKGRFELADGGTLFLDEIGELTPAMQVKLLRVLQEREIERLGGAGPIRLDVRLITATHRPLETLIEAGTFREDLYYRLNVFSIFSPPLRERRTDVALLADHFLEHFAREHRCEVRRFSPAALDRLAGHRWPGNVRELANTVERAVLTCEGGVVHVYHLPPALQTADAPDAGARTDLAEAIAAFERDLIQEALAASQGNFERAARLLNTTSRIIRYKVRKHGIAGAPVA